MVQYAKILDLLFKDYLFTLKGNIGALIYLKIY